MKHFLIALCFAPALSSAAPAPLKFQEAKSMTDVFTVKEPGQASFLNSHMAYNEWREKHAGKFFPMEVSPILAGQLAGGVPMPPTVRIEPSQYEEQAREFAEVVNTRNQGGRPGLPPSLTPTPAQKRYSDDQGNTHVVQTVLSTVLPRSLSQLKLNPENFAGIIENSDIDHYHFRIPGSFAVQALETDHIAAKGMKPDTAYLLSVIDFRQYGCAAMKNGLSAYFSKEENKKKLMNESMYLISDLTMNVPADIAATEKMFGKRPDAVLGQQIIFADRLIRGARTLFIFFSEGANTRVVLVSSIGMQSKHFVGASIRPDKAAKALVAQTTILYGIKSGVTGGVIAASDATERLLGGATADVNKKNACDRGLAKGLIKYAQGLFGEFLGGLIKDDKG
jgi:hypothetical protein